MNLVVVNTFESHWLNLISDDPVRPNIPARSRVGHNREVFVLQDDKNGKHQAVCCAAFIGAVPETESDLFADWYSFNVAVFYTVWSYDKGSGRTIINKALNHIKWFKPFVTQAVTLSPKTDMARRFHLRNGASEYRINENTVNFEYKL